MSFFSLFSRKKNKTDEGTRKADAISKIVVVDSRTTEAYDEAIALINSNSQDEKDQGRQLMLIALREIRAVPGTVKDPRLYLWAGREYEDHHCFKSAAVYYKLALDAGHDAAAELVEKYNNPYNLDSPFYDIRGDRKCGTFALQSFEEKKAAYLEIYAKARKTFENAQTDDEREMCLKTIRLLATADLCAAPNANTFLGDIEEDKKAAAEWYKVAATLDDAEGARKYADALAFGTGVTKNEEEALHYYEIASQNGDLPSKYRLGALFESKGEEKKALHYYKLAANGGYKGAAQKAQEMDSIIRKDENGKYANQLQEQRNEVIAKYKAILEKYALAGAKIDPIFQPDNFCENAFQYCIKRFGVNDYKRLLTELCEVAYFGCIHAVVLWLEDKTQFDSNSVWEVLRDSVDAIRIFPVDSLNSFLNTEESVQSTLPKKARKRRIRGRSDRVYEVIREYIKATESIFLEDFVQGDISQFAIKEAYCLGMRVATTEIEKERGLSVFSEGNSITQDCQEEKTVS